MSQICAGEIEEESEESLLKKREKGKKDKKEHKKEFIVKLTCTSSPFMYFVSFGGFFF